MSDLRTALESALETHEKEDAPAAAAPAPAPEPVTVDAEPKSERVEPAVTEPSPEPVAKPAEPLAEKANKEPISADGDAQKRPAGSSVRAPVSWKPEIREKWSSVDPEIQLEVLRRERDVTEALRTSSDARKFQQEFNSTVAPYMSYIQAEGATPMDGFKYYLQTAAMFRIGSPQEKANAVAQIIRQFNVDIGTLDSILSGQQVQAPDPAYRQLQQQFAPVVEYVNQLKGREQQVVSQNDQKLSKALEDFASDPANEFFEDVREEVADWLDLASRRGQSMTLQEAYNRAIMHHPTISKIVEQRKIAANVAQQNAAAQKARNAAVSVPASGAPSHGSEGKSTKQSLRSDLEAAFESHSDSSR